ncbi:hypothetical protein ACFYY1_18035 [Streptomyces sp. NPDC001890]|uniref:hypothetical protein n=1 Tax=Streptomyces sp. NPDC001890 TaxID=3364620 RepID=UPI0036CC7878
MCISSAPGELAQGSSENYEKLARKHNNNTFCLLMKVVNSQAYDLDVVELVADVTRGAQPPYRPYATRTVDGLSSRRRLDHRSWARGPHGPGSVTARLGHYGAGHWTRARKGPPRLRDPDEMAHQGRNDRNVHD